MPLELQVKLLRLIQNGEIEKVGATRADTCRCSDHRRHAPQPASVDRGWRFREDLYYRLAVIPLEFPPLRERAEDIPELVAACCS